MDEHLTRREARMQDRGRPRRARRRDGGSLAVLAVAPLALLGSGAFVFQASNAAFTARTTATAQFATGTVTLTNSSPSGVLFNVSGMKPGDSSTQCVDVTYSGSLRSAVKLYLTSPTATGPASPANLADFMRFTVQEGSDTCASNPSYSYIAGSGAAGVSLTTLENSSSYSSNAIGSWDTQSATVHSFKVTYSLPDYGSTGPAFGTTGAPATQAAFDAVQGTTVGATFTWEARNV